MRLAPLAAALAALAAPACIHVGTGETPVERRAFDLRPPLPEGVPVEAEGPETLWVEPFSADPAVDRDEIVWRRGPVESGAYASYRWARPPAEAVRDVLADHLARSGAFAVVATEPRPPAPDFALRGHLVRCEESDAGEAWSGVVEVRIALFRSRDGSEVLRRTYARSERAARRNPEGVAEAVRKALEEIGVSLAEDVRAALGAEREPTPPP